MSAPVRDATGRIIAAISVSSTVEYTVEYMDMPRMQALIDEVKPVAAEISADLGFRRR